MAIPLGPLYDRARKNFGASDGPLFQDSFVECVNAVVGDLHAAMGGELFEYALASSNTDTLELDEQYTNVLKAGIAKYLNDDKQWGREPNPIIQQRYEIERRNAILLAIADDDLEVGYVPEE